MPVTKHRPAPLPLLGISRGQPVVVVPDVARRAAVEGPRVREQRRKGSVPEQRAEHFRPTDVVVSANTVKGDDGSVIAHFGCGPQEVRGGVRARSSAQGELKRRASLVEGLAVFRIS